MLGMIDTVMGTRWKNALHGAVVEAGCEAAAALQKLVCCPDPQQVLGSTHTIHVGESWRCCRALLNLPLGALPFS